MRRGGRPDEGHRTPDAPREPAPHPRGRCRGLLDLSPQAGGGQGAHLSDHLADLLAAGEPAILVEIAEARGSTPRAAGTAMLVTLAGSRGTIGGGALEYHAIDVARAMLARGQAHRRVPMALGPLLGQCCGGHVVLDLVAAGPSDAARLVRAERAERRARPDVLVFGLGHTGLALARALAPLPFRTALVDDRLDPLDAPPDGVALVRLDDPAEAVAEARPGSAYVILTHSHALDYRLAEAALRRGDAAYVGLIGSATKRERFRRFFRQGGGEDELARLVCPIGGGGVPDKRPEVIAALVAAELLAAFARYGSCEAPRQPAAAERA